MSRKTDRDDSGADDQPKMTFFERLRYTMVKPDDDGNGVLKTYSCYDINEIQMDALHAYRETPTVERFCATLPISRFGSQISLTWSQSA